MWVGSHHMRSARYAKCYSKASGWRGLQLCQSKQSLENHVVSQNKGSRMNDREELRLRAKAGSTGVANSGAIVSNECSANDSPDPISRISGRMSMTRANPIYKSSPAGPSGYRAFLRLGLSVGTLLIAGVPGYAAELSRAEELLETGKYAECAELATEGIKESRFDETWQHLKIQSQMAQGLYPEALETTEDALGRFRSSIRLRWLARDVYRHNGQSRMAGRRLEEIERLVQRRPSRYGDSANRLVLGQYLLEKGADARQVLDLFYKPVKQRRPDYVPAYIASGELALEKNDYRLAADEFRQALKVKPQSVAGLYGLARALAPSEPEESGQLLSAALKINPNHVDCLLMLVDGHVDAEEYSRAETVLKRIERINPRHPRAWAYQAVLAHLSNDSKSEQSCRDEALSSWSENPEIDHLIGRKLSQKYRFSEGAGYQRRALEIDPDYLPAKVQLSQDLLRLGQEEAGWKLAGEVFDKDGYNVVAHNLVTLQEQLNRFETLEQGGIILRMDAREARIYGHRALKLLLRAKQQLCEKYDVELSEPVIVEVFPEQQDFAIRTFGLPGGAGFLGVCFGPVITANSPASRGDNPTNWESVLWHEFCHAVTLRKTRNKMPRWLSEGISVYEEKQADVSWGKTMTPKYREMVLGGELTRVGQLSGAFLQPPSPLHLQFAYYESSLVVEYLVEKFGIDAMKQILDDLAVGMPINEALGRHTVSIEQLEQEFAEFASERANNLAPQADWEKPGDPSVDPHAQLDEQTLARWNEAHPNSYWGLQLLAKRRMAANQWKAAKEPLQKLIGLYPDDISADCAHRLLAAVHRELGETVEEREVLSHLASLDADAVDVYLRLMKLDAAEGDWQRVAEVAERMLAVNPLIAAPHRSLAQAAEHLGDDVRAISSYQALLEMDPVDPAELHYRLARLQKNAGDLEASRRQVLQSLEEAPRFRAALRLLLDIESETQNNSGESAKPVGETLGR